MTIDVTRAAEQLRQTRAARQRQIRDALDAAQTAARSFGAAHAPGDPVFDVVSGQEGEVVGRTVENIIVPVAKR